MTDEADSSIVLAQLCVALLGSVEYIGYLYLESAVSYDSSEPEDLSRIDQAAAVLTKLKPA